MSYISYDFHATKIGKTVRVKIVCGQIHILSSAVFHLGLTGLHGWQTQINRRVNEGSMSARQPFTEVGYTVAKFTTFFPREDASPDTIRGWIRSWFSNRGLKLPTHQEGVNAAYGEFGIQGSIEKIAWDGRDIRSFSQDTMESDMECWDFGSAYSRMVVADILKARDQVKSLSSRPSYLYNLQNEVSTSDHSPGAPAPIATKTTMYWLNQGALFNHHLCFAISMVYLSLGIP